MKISHILFLTSFLFVCQHAFCYGDSLKKEIPRKTIYRGSTQRVNDIIHTSLDVQFDWNKSQMRGKAAITAKPYFKPTAHLDLNARSMDILSVEVYDLGKTTQTKMPPANQETLNSKKLNSSFKYENDSVKIELGRVFNADEKYMVKINYVAKPDEIKNGGSSAISDDRGLFFINPKGEQKNKMPQIWTQGETQATSAWCPTIDSPNEKMTQDIFMTVDSKYTTLSNGSLVSGKNNPDGTRTDHWKMDQPHSPYLMLMAVGEFKKVIDAPWNGKEISYYVEKEYEPHAKAIFGNTKEMINFYSGVLGTPYPWDKYAQIVVRDYVSGAMENTTATLHGDFMVYQTTREMLDGKKGEAVIAHELFHQWFGDLVTAESWSNLPLNESFATYGEYLWEEYKNGRDAADAHSYKSRMGYFQSSENQVNLIRFEYNNREDMFDAFSYNKGGQVLHMLRKYTGDKAFFESLKLYLQNNRFKNAEIHDLRLAFEEVTGEDLNWFFNQWFLGKGHPELDIQKSYDAANKMVKLTVKQKQNLTECPLYVLPVDIDIYAGGKKERHRIVIDQQQQEFSFKSETSPDLVNFDAERQLLAIKTYTKSTEEFIFQYKNAPLFSDRYEAINNLKGKTEKQEVVDVFAFAAEKDPWFELRAAALPGFKPVAAAKELEIKPLLMRIAKTDKNTNVRAAAIDLLSEQYKGTELDELYKNSINEQSYAIASSALKAIAASDPKVGLQKAKELESEKNDDIFAAVSTVYSTYGSDENNPYFLKMVDQFSGPSAYLYLYYYGRFLKQCNNPVSFEKAAAVFEEIIKSTNGQIKDYAKKTYEESIIGNLKTKREELKKQNASETKLNELGNMLAKLESSFKSISTP
jgi:aminopeptidase N